MMKRVSLAVLAVLAAVPAVVLADDEPPKPETLAVDALVDKFGNPKSAVNLQISRPETSGKLYRFCATTDGFNKSGHFIGLTYWEIILDPDDPDRAKVRDVTGLFSDCYSARFHTPQD